MAVALELTATLVIDASVGVKWVVEETGSDAAAKLLQGYKLLTPTLFWVEAANTVATKVRRGELDRAAVQEAWSDLLQVPITTHAVSQTLVGKALSLAQDLRHPVYDLCYLVMALDHGGCVVTADRRFATFAQRNAPWSSKVILLNEIV